VARWPALLPLLWFSSIHDGDGQVQGAQRLKGAAVPITLIDDDYDGVSVSSAKKWLSRLCHVFLNFAPRRTTGGGSSLHSSSFLSFALLTFLLQLQRFVFIVVVWLNGMVGNGASWNSRTLLSASQFTINIITLIQFISLYTLVGHHGKVLFLLCNFVCLLLFAIAAAVSQNLRLWS